MSLKIFVFSFFLASAVMNFQDSNPDDDDGVQAVGDAWINSLSNGQRQAAGKLKDEKIFELLF